MNSQLIPAEATHPGELIRDELKERGLTQKQLAMDTGIKPSVISETINGKRSVSVKTAAALESVLGIPAEYWLNLQSQYDLDTAAIAGRAEKKESYLVTIPVQDKNLLKDLVRKFGWACMF
jgi:addiction module HigA family antidote